MGMSSEAKVWVGVAGLVVVAGIGLFTIPDWLQRRAETREIERVLTAADGIAVEFEGCVVEGAAPHEYGRAISERLLLDRGYEGRIRECFGARDEAIAALLETVGSGPTPVEILSLHSWRVHTPLRDEKLGRAQICGALEIQRGLRADIHEIVDETEPPAVMDCPAYDGDYESRLPKCLAAPEGTSAMGWRAQSMIAGKLIARQQQEADQPARIASFAQDGSATSIDLPTHLERALLRWGPGGPVAVARPDEQRHASGTAPYQVERWTDRFEARPAPRGMGTPEELWLTPERWFLASIGDDPDKPTDVTLHISDDEGEHYQALTPDLPTLPSPRRFVLTGHAEGSELLMLAARSTDGVEDFEPELRGHPAEIQIGVVRINAAAEVETGALIVGHRAIRRWQVQVQVCATDEGAFAVLGGEVVVVVEGVEPKLAHTFGAGQELDSSSLMLACHGSRAVILARRHAEPEPGGIDSRNGPLYRILCDADGCDDGELLTDWATRWDLRSTEAGVRAFAELQGGPVSSVYLIDEPLGGPVETRMELESCFAPVDGFVWDGITFVFLRAARRWGWF